MSRLALGVLVLMLSCVTAAGNAASLGDPISPPAPLSDDGTPPWDGDDGTPPVVDPDSDADPVVDPDNGAGRLDEFLMYPDSGATYFFWRLWKVAAYLPMIIVALLTIVAVLVAIHCLLFRVSSHVESGGLSTEQQVFPDDPDPPPRWWDVLSSAYKRLNILYVATERRVNITFGLALGAICVSLSIAMLLMRNLQVGGSASESFPAFFSFVSPILLFQAVAFFFARTSLQLQKELNKVREEWNAVHRAMYQASLPDGASGTLQCAFAVEQSIETKDSESDTAPKDFDGKELNPRLLAALINAASWVGMK